ncbi:MAG: DUF2752 domain-containing protein [Planctomycetota bacterium]
MSSSGPDEESGDYARPMSAGERVLLVLLLCTVATVFVALASVEPDPRGYGTHERFGLAPCSWPVLYDMPCPTCGVTTAVSLLLHLRPVEAVLTQPFGVLTAMLGFVFLGLGSLHFWRGESLLARAAALPMAWVLGGILISLLASWIYVIRTS